MILIIGSNGYIGSFLAEQFLRKGYDVIRSCRRTPATPLMISSASTIIYLGGLTRRSEVSSHLPDVVYEENVGHILKTLSFASSPNQLFIYASTAAIAEGYIFKSMKESDPPNEELFDAYTKSMYQRELAIEDAVKKMNTRPKAIIGLRMGTVIGLSPSQNTHFCYLKMIYDALTKKEVKYTPNLYRPILYFDDLFSSIEKLHNHFHNSFDELGTHNIYNLSSFNVSMQEIAESIAKLTDSVSVQDQIESSATPYGFTLDNSKIKSKLDISFKATHEYVLKSLMSHRDILINRPCMICAGVDTEFVLNLGYQPLANDFVSTPFNKQELYPLPLFHCKECLHSQLNYIVSPDKMFKHYLYKSGTSETMRKYFKDFALKCDANCSVFISGRIPTVLEIACNDGSQLDAFAELGWKTFGVDPAENLVEIAKSKGHIVECAFWGDGMKLPNEFPVAPDVIIAANVLAHVPNPVNFLKAIVKVMSPSTLLYVQTSQANMFVNGEFDTIYHEHMSFFSCTSFYKAADICGLKILNVEKVAVHGTSFLVTMSLSGSLNSKHFEHPLLSFEKKNYTRAFFKNYRDSVYNCRAWFINELKKHSSEGYEIYAYGAAAKGMTLLNFAEPFSSRYIKYIFDDSPLKHFTFAPGVKIPVIPFPPQDDILAIPDKSLFVILAWNMKDEITSKIKGVVNILKATGKEIRVKILLPFPYQEVNEI